MACCFGAGALDELPFTYNLSQSLVKGRGVGVPDTYDICIRLDKIEFKGYKVSSFTVPVVTDGGTVNPKASAWCIASLPQDGDPLEPLAKVDVTINDGILTATFPEPYVIGDDPVYIGYTLTVDDVENKNKKFPIATVSGSTPGSLYYRTHSTKTTWTDQAHAQSNAAMSPMTVMLAGDIPASFGELTILSEPFAPVNEKATVYASLKNLGCDPISSLSISYSKPGEETPVKIPVTLSDPLSNLFGSECEFTFSLPAEATTGNIPVTFTLDEVNGFPNALSPIISTNLSTVKFVPVNRPLVEEYTGLWCTSCASGYVAMEQGRYYFGRDFVGVAYHSNDVLQRASFFYPSKVTGYPTVYINRKRSGTFSLIDDWKNLTRTLAPVDIKLHIEWAGEEKEFIRVISESQFLNDYQDADIRVCYTLVADKLSDPDWKQANAYWGDNGEGLDGPFWNLFTGPGVGMYVPGLEFNDVSCVFDDALGIPGSLPSEIVAYTPYQNTSYININNAIAERSREVIWQNKDNLRVIAVVVDAKTNIVLNSISSDYTAEIPVAQGVKGVYDDEVDSPVIRTEYMDLQGRRLPAIPEAGTPCIILDHHENGEVTSRKVVIRK